jgi:hypothetical protein
MRKYIVLALVAVLAVAVGVAYAQEGDKVTASAQVTKGGTKKKPKNVSAHYLAEIEGAVPGQRADTITKLDTEFVGLKENGKYFETCTAEEIDAAQSDAACPEGAVVGTGRIEAKIGPEADKTQASDCKKDIKVYNEGAGKVNVFSSGNPSDCLGIGYLPPVPGTMKRSGNKLLFSLPIPPNIQTPLPGVSGYFSLVEVTFDNGQKVKGAKGKQVTYLQSVGCGKAKKRGFKFTAFTTGAPQGIVASSTAGRCK